MDAPNQPVPAKGSRWIVLGVASLAIAGGSYWLLRVGHLPLLPERERIAVPFVHLAVFSALYLAAMALRIVRWRWQLRPIGRVSAARVWSASLIGNAAVILMPLRSGELVRLVLISRGTPIPFLAALGTAGCERLVDALTAALLLLTSLLAAEIHSPLPDHIGDLPVPAAIVPTLGYTAAAATLVATALVLVFFYFRRATIAVIKAVFSSISPKLGAFLEQKLTQLTLGLDFLRHPGNAVKYFGATWAYWGLQLLAIWYFLRNVGFEDASLAQAGIVAGTIAFSASLPNAPGFFGIFQIAIYASLALFHPATVVQERGSVVAFWIYALEVGWILALSPAAFWIARHEQRITAPTASSS